MVRSKNKLLQVVLWLLLFVTDVFGYVYLVLLFMNYTDFYDESEGPWMSLASMTPEEKIIYFAIDFWVLINLFFAAWLIYRGYKWVIEYRNDENGTLSGQTEGRYRGKNT